MQTMTRIESGHLVIAELGESLEDIQWEGETKKPVPKREIRIPIADIKTIKIVGNCTVKWGDGEAYTLEGIRNHQALGGLIALSDFMNQG